MMKALVFDGMLKVSEHAAKPAPMPGEALIRVREAAGAQILAVACPQCAVMLEDAAKVENLDGTMRVQELSEIVAERVG